jgi:Eukaryotic cytochrome b561
MQHNDPFLTSRTAALTPAKRAKNNADIAHGTAMGIAVVLVLPIGTMITRLPGPHRRLGVRIHVFCQLFGMLLLLAGFGMGVWTSIIHTEVFTDPHTVLGTVITGFLFLQPTLGYLHHRYFVEKGTRSWWTRAHVWFGRAILVMAVANGGYGIQYANNSPNGEIGYGVAAGVVGVVYIGLTVVWYLRRTRGEKREVEEVGSGGVGLAGSKQEEIVVESPTV